MDDIEAFTLRHDGKILDLIVDVCRQIEELDRDL